MATEANILLQIKASVSDAIKGIDLLTSKIGNLGGVLSGFVNIQNSNNTSTKNSTKNITDNSTTVNNNSKAIQDNSTNVKNNSKVINDNSNTIINKTTIINRDTKAQEDNTRSIGASALAIAGLSAVLTGFFTSMSNPFIEFDKQMRNVNSIAQVSEKQFAGLVEGVKKISTDPLIVDGPINLSKAFYQLESSGFHASKALEIAGQASQAATAGLTTTEVSVKALSAVMNSYNQKGLQDAINFSDDLFRIVDKGVVTFEQLATQISSVHAQASLSNISLKETGALYIMMTRHGIQASETETAITNLIRSIQAPSKESLAWIKKYNKEFNTSFDLSESALQVKGLKGVLQDLYKISGGSAKVLDTLIPEARAKKAAIIGMSDAVNEFNESLGYMKTSSGSTFRALSQQSKSADFDIKLLTKSFELLKIELGELVFKGFTPMLRVAKESMETFQLLPKGLKETGVQVGLLTLGVAGLSGAFLGLSFLLKPIIGLFTSIWSKVILAGGVLLEFAGTMQGVFMLLGASPSMAFLTGLGVALGVAVASVYTLYKGLQTVKAYIDMLKSQGQAEKDNLEQKKVLTDALDRQSQAQRRLNDAKKQGQTEENFTKNLTSEELRQSAIDKRILANHASNIEARKRLNDSANKDIEKIQPKKKIELDISNKKAQDSANAQAEAIRRAKLLEDQESNKKKKQKIDTEYNSFVKKLNNDIRKEAKGEEEEELSTLQEKYNEELKKFGKTAQDKKLITQRFEYDKTAIISKYALENLKTEREQSQKFISQKLQLKEIDEKLATEEQIRIEKRYDEGLKSLLSKTKNNNVVQKNLKTELADSIFKIDMDKNKLLDIEFDKTQKAKANKYKIEGENKKALSEKEIEFDKAQWDYELSETKTSTELKIDMKNQELDEIATLDKAHSANYVKGLQELEALENQLASEKVSLYNNVFDSISNGFNVLRNSSVGALAQIGDSFGIILSNAKGLYNTFNTIQDSLKSLSASGINKISDFTDKMKAGTLTTSEFGSALSIASVIAQGSVESINFFATGVNNLKNIFDGTTNSLTSFLKAQKDLISSTPFIGQGLGALMDTLNNITGANKLIDQEKWDQEKRKSLMDFEIDTQRMERNFANDKYTDLKNDYDREVQATLANSKILRKVAIDDRLAILEKEYYKKLDEMRKEDGAKAQKDLDEQNKNQLQEVEKTLDELKKKKENYTDQLKTLNDDMYNKEKSNIEKNAQILSAPYQLAITEIEKQLKTLDEYIDYINRKYDKDKQKLSVKSSDEFNNAVLGLQDNPNLFRQEIPAFEQDMLEKRMNIQKSFSRGAFDEPERLRQLKEINVLEFAFFDRRKQETTGRKARVELELKANQAFENYKQSNIELLTIQKDEQVKQVEESKKEESRQLEAKKSIIEQLKTDQENALNSLDTAYKGSSDSWLSYMKYASSSWSTDLRAKILSIQAEMDKTNTSIFVQEQKVAQKQAQSIGNPYLSNNSNISVDDQIKKIYADELKEYQLSKALSSQTKTTPITSTFGKSLSSIATQFSANSLNNSGLAQAFNTPNYADLVGGLVSYHAKGGVSHPNKINIFGERGPEVAATYKDMQVMYDKLVSPSNYSKSIMTNSNNSISVNVTIQNPQFGSDKDMSKFKTDVKAVLTQTAQDVYRSY